MKEITKKLLRGKRSVKNWARSYPLSQWSQLEEIGNACMFRSQTETVGLGYEAGSAGRDNFDPRPH